MRYEFHPEALDEYEDAARRRGLASRSFSSRQIHGAHGAGLFLGFKKVSPFGTDTGLIPFWTRMETSQDFLSGIFGAQLHAGMKCGFVWKASLQYSATKMERRKRPRPAMFQFGRP
jgi:hypothetical protein